MGLFDIIRTLLDKGGSPDDIVKQKGLLKVEGDIISNRSRRSYQGKSLAVADFKAGRRKRSTRLSGRS